MRRDSGEGSRKRAHGLIEPKLGLKIKIGKVDIYRNEGKLHSEKRESL